MATAVCQDMDNKGVVCPAQLYKGLFASGALDNLDHDLSSTTAKGAYHHRHESLPVPYKVEIRGMLTMY